MGFHEKRREHRSAGGTRGLKNRRENIQGERRKIHRAIVAD
jgi:hypothetical protein